MGHVISARLFRVGLMVGVPWGLVFCPYRLQSKCTLFDSVVIADLDEPHHLLATRKKASFQTSVECTKWSGRNMVKHQFMYLSQDTVGL